MVRATLAPIRDSRGHVLYVFAQIQDITAQRAIASDLHRSQETFRRLVMAVGEYAIFMLEADGTVASWNFGAQRIKGYPADEIVGQHFRVFYPPEDQAASHPEHNLEVALRTGSCTEEGWRVRRDGSRFWASVVITPVYDDNARHVGFAKVTRDLTQQRDHEEERQRFIDQRTQLLAMTAHELRNPIAVIDGSAVALGEELPGITDHLRDELLGGIRKGVNRLRRLAADLGQTSRADGDTLPMQMREVSLADTMQGAATRSKAARGDLEVELDWSDDAVFWADGERLAQALDNLLENAVRHGTPPVALSGSVDADVSFRVSDGGAGVSPELEPRLFERFARAEPSGGTGLGLYLVREIARRHGGDAVYHRPEGETPTAFEIRFPLRRLDGEP